MRPQRQALLFRRLIRSRWGVAAALLLTGCATNPPVGDETVRREMLALLMPSRIEIVEPFTRVKSFDDDNIPDGIEVLLQAVNALDNPGLMVVGRVRVELFEYIAASADPKGRRLEHWEIELSTKSHQRTYWNQLTQMYEFRLGVAPEVIPRAAKYVLRVTYDSPLGERLTDEYLIEYRPGGGPLGGVRKETGIIR